MSRRGSFDYRTLVGVTDGHWGPGVYERPVMGLPVAGQHVWGAIRVGARRFLLIRHFMNEMAGRFLTYEAPIGEDMTYRTARGYSGLCEIGDLDGQWGIYQPGTPPSFSFTAVDEHGRWVDGGADLRLRLHPTALQFVTPDAEEPLAYFARAFDVVDGTFDGQPVDAGVVMHEQVYLSSGRGWMLSRHKRELQGAWIAFANRYADGSSEFGSVCVGTRGWQFAVVISSDGYHVLADRPAGTATSDGETFTVEVDFGDRGVWRWRPPAEGGGRVPLPGPRGTTPLWAEGVFQRDGDDRELTFAHTWAEVYPHHLDATTQAQGGLRSPSCGR